MKANPFFLGFLNGWLYKNLPDSKHVEKIDGLDDLHVVGECKDCEFWEQRLPPTQEFGDCLTFGGVKSHRYGCIDFKKKEI